MSILLSAEMEVDGNLKVTGTVESVTIDSLKAVIAELQAQLNSNNDGIVIKECFGEFSALEGENDTLYVYDLIGLNLNRVMVDILDVQWTSPDNQDIDIKLEAISDSSITKSNGFLEARGNFEGTTEVFKGRDPSGSVGASLKLTSTLIISGENPYLLITPHSWNGFGGSGILTIWVYSNFYND